MDPTWRQKLLVCSGTGDGPVKVEEERTSTMRDDLIQLFQKDELKKYLTPEEIEAIPQ
jgi:succinate dehydrogenase / fumarate reductase flavoprotein subunit